MNLKPKEFSGRLTMKLYTIIPLLLYVSKNKIVGDTTARVRHVYSLHITPFLEISFNSWK